mmetsp:Transcript_45248/g.127969  ORF Transcript_45248/g.127969 Transcript_45248/m.127969 type:complete len:263 (-) Transcript_45248:946-1734(-)
MVRPALLVKNEVPIAESFVPVVHVSENTLTVAFAHKPISHVCSLLLTHLCHDQMLVGLEFVHTPDVVEAAVVHEVGPPVMARVPVPVVAHPPDVLACFWVAVDGLCPQAHVITIVVPAYDLQVKPAGLESRPKMVTDKIALFLSIEEAILPPIFVVRLILHGETPKWQPGFFACLCELDEVLGPRLEAVRLEVPTEGHPLVVLHPRCWAPRARKQGQWLPCYLKRPLRHGEDFLIVPGRGEGLELSVAILLATSPVAAREVA